MSQERALVKNTFILGFGKVIAQVAVFALLPVYTIFLSPEEFGIVDLVTVYVALLAPLLMIQLDRAAFRELIEARGDHEKSKAVISNALYIVLSVLAVSLVLFFIVCWFVDVPYASLVALAIIGTVLSTLAMQFARGLGRNDLYAIASIVLGVGSFAIIATFVVSLHMGVSGVLAGLVMANLLTVLFLLVKLRLYSYVSFSNSVLSRGVRNSLLRFAWPLVPSAISWWFIKTFDRTLVTAIVGLTANGIYAAANKYSLIFTSIYSIFDMSWTESASAHINSKNRDIFFSSVYNKSFKFFASLAVGLIAITPFVFGFIIGPDYNDAKLYIPVLILGAFLNALVSQYSVVYLAKKMTTAVLVTSIVSASISVVLNLVLINTIGVMGAAVSLVVTFFVMAVWRHYDIKKYVNIKFERFLFTRLVLLFAIVMTCYYLSNDILNIATLLGVVLFGLWFSRETLGPAFRAILSRIKK